MDWNCKKRTHFQSEIWNVFSFSLHYIRVFLLSELKPPLSLSAERTHRQGP